MRSTILAALVLSFASLALGGCAADAEEPVTNDSTVTSEQGASPIAENKVRARVEKEASLVAFDDDLRDLATKEGFERFEGKRVGGVESPAVNIADGRRDVIIGGGSESAADMRRDVTGNGGFAEGLAQGRIDDVEQPAGEMFETALDESVRVNANKEDIRRKARAAK